MKQFNFDPFAMIHPKNDRDIAAILDEALAELRSINANLDNLLAETPIGEPA
jgi:hypothetical protein